MAPLLLSLSLLAGVVVETVQSDGSPAVTVDVFREGPGLGKPVVVFFHGGVWQFGGRRQVENVGAAMAREGFVGVVASYRLAPASRWPAQIEDAAAVVALVKAKATSWGGDPARIVLVGHSAGGHLATLLTVDDRWLQRHGLVPRDVAGVVALSGVFDLRSPLDEGQDDGGFERFIVPVFGRDPATLRAASPLDAGLAARGAPPVPLLLVTSTNDYAAMRDQTDAWARALRLRGVEAPVVVIPDRDHFGLVGEIGEAGDRTTAEIVRFVRRVGSSSSSPSSPLPSTRKP